MTMKKFWSQNGMYIVLALFFLGITLAANGMGDYDTAEQTRTFHLDLTSEGCRYAKTLKLPVNDNEICHVVARFRPFRFSSGGILYRPDGEQVQITTSMLLGYSIEKTELAQSERERSDEQTGLVKLAAGGALAVLMVWALSIMTRN